MKSGIYKLTFDNGSIYIGKSVDLERRIAEHTASFAKGTAAKKLQNAYILAGYPTAKILLECHADHLDLMESVFMILELPDLNTTAPIKLTSEEINTLYDNEELLKDSTCSHIDEINTLYEKLAISQDLLEEKELEYFRDINSLEEELRKLRRIRTEEELRTDLGKKLEECDQDHHRLMSDYEMLVRDHNELVKQFKKPLWKKVFGIK